MALTSTGYFRQRLSDESMSPDIVLLEMFLSLVIAVMNSLHSYTKRRYLCNKNNIILNRIRDTFYQKQLCIDEERKIISELL